MSNKNMITQKNSGAKSFDEGRAKFIDKVEFLIWNNFCFVVIFVSVPLWINMTGKVIQFGNIRKDVFLNLDSIV